MAIRSGTTAAYLGGLTLVIRTLTFSRWRSSSPFPGRNPCHCRTASDSLAIICKLVQRLLQVSIIMRAAHHALLGMTGRGSRRSSRTPARYSPATGALRRRVAVQGPRGAGHRRRPGAAFRGPGGHQGAYQRRRRAPRQRWALPTSPFGQAFLRSVTSMEGVQRTPSGLDSWCAI